MHSTCQWEQNQARDRVRTSDPSSCNRKLYHWATRASKQTPPSAQTNHTKTKQTQTNNTNYTRNAAKTLQHHSTSFTQHTQNTTTRWTINTTAPQHPTSFTHSTLRATSPTQNISPTISLYRRNQVYQPECQPIDGSTALRSCNIAPIHTQLSAIQFESRDELNAIHRSTKRQRKQRPYCIIVLENYIIVFNYNILLFRSILLEYNTLLWYTSSLSVRHKRAIVTRRAVGFI